MTFPKLLGSLDPTTLVKEDSFQTENLKQQKIASQNVIIIPERDPTRAIGHVLHTSAPAAAHT